MTLFKRKRSQGLESELYSTPASVLTNCMTPHLSNEEADTGSWYHLIKRKYIKCSAYWLVKIKRTINVSYLWVQNRLLFPIAHTPPPPGTFIYPSSAEPRSGQMTCYAHESRPKQSFPRRHFKIQLITHCFSTLPWHQLLQDPESCSETSRKPEADPQQPWHVARETNWWHE